MAFYNRMRSTAFRLVTKYGVPAQIERDTVTNYDPIEGTGDKLTSTFDVFAVMTNYQLSERDGNLIKQGDQLALLTTNEQPLPSDRLNLDGGVWQVVNVDLVKPGGVDVLYKCQVRKS